MNRLSVFIYRPVYLELRIFRIVRMVVGISPGITVAYPMLGHARTRLVDGVVRQAASAECDFSRHPCRIIRTLGVIRVPVDVSLFALIVFPLYIPVCRSGTVVSDFVVADGGKMCIRDRYRPGRMAASM